MHFKITIYSIPKQDSYTVQSHPQKNYLKLSLILYKIYLKDIKLK